MDYVFPIANTLHALAAVIWVGGMFFAHQVLRPALGANEPPVRLGIWGRVFARFFTWVWLAVILLPATGYAMVYAGFGGFESAGMHVTAMHAIGWVMIVIYVYLYIVPYGQYRQAVREEDWPRAGQILPTIRRIVGTNLTLGLITIVIAVSGRFWG